MKMQAVTLQGEERYDILFPKYKEDTLYGRSRSQRVLSKLKKYIYNEQ